MKQIDLREGARRQHRAIAVYAVIQCWLRGLDGIVFDRPALERLLGLERFKQTRVEWLQEDLLEFFPYQEVFWLDGAPNSFHSIFASRKALDSYLPSGTMSTAYRIKRMKEGGPSLDMFHMWPRPTDEQRQNAFDGVVPFFSDQANYDERLLASYLTLLINGQISPTSLPARKEPEVLSD